jgi:transcriptional regulator with GAF, ATPase, and Fis domain
LLDYAWPGNVRELQNVIERAVIGAHFGILRFDVPNHHDRQARGETNLNAASSEGVEVIPAEEMKRRERDNLIAALRRSEGKIYGAGGAAELLGIRPTTLNARVKKLGLKQLQ